MWHTVVLIVHVFVAFSLIGLVLLQRGKGAEAGTGFGAGASGTVFGARGSANFLSRSTAILATLFFATCLGLVYLSTQAPPDDGILEQLDRNRPRATVPEIPGEPDRAPNAADNESAALTPADGTSTPSPGAAANGAPAGSAEQENDGR